MDNYFYVECPICSKKLKVITKTHFRLHGYNTKEELLKDYPNTILVSEKYRVSNAEIRKEVFTKLNKSQEQRLKASSHCKKLNQDSERQKAKSRKAWSDEKQRIAKRDEMLALLDKINNSPDYEDFRKRRLKGFSYGKKIPYLTEKGNLLQLRSFLECKVCKFLELNNFDFNYESIEIEYLFENKSHKYYPDFYLKDYNLILEVKPLPKQSDGMVLAKRQASIDKGYNFMFVSENDLKDYENLIYSIDKLPLDAK